MWIVRLALRRPYTFVVASLLLLLLTPFVLLPLPSNALLFRAAGLQVAVVQPDDTIALRKVQVGRDFGQTVEILAGVTNTDRVVASPTDSLLAGTRVRVAAAQDSAKAK